MEIEQIQLARNRVQNSIEELEKRMKKIFSPDGYKDGKNYADCESSHGSRREFDFVKLGDELIRLKVLRDTYDCILEDDKVYIDEDLILSKLKGRIEQVRFLRIVRGYTQQEVADKLEISTRTVQRIEKDIQNEIVVMNGVQLACE